MSQITTTRNQLRISLLALVVLFAGGTAGYMAIGGRSLFEALYITVVILTTVGLKEGGEQLSNAELAWSMMLMLIGIGAVLYTTSIVVAFVIDGNMQALLGRRQQMNRINSLKDHFIVIGFGRMGQALCQTLNYREVPFVLIDTREERLHEAEELGYLCFHGDAMQEMTLLTVGVDRAKGLATCLPDDARNVFVTLTARSLNDGLTIIARAEEVETERKMMRAGASRVICPPLIGASRVTDLLLNPAVEEMLELDGHWPDLELSKLSIQRFPGAVGKTIGDLKLGDDVIVAAVASADGTRRINPTPDTQLVEGDEIVVVGASGCINQTVQRLGGEQAA